MRMSDGSSYVCSSELCEQRRNRLQLNRRRGGIILGGERLQNGLGETKDSELCQMKYSQKSERRRHTPQVWARNHASRVTKRPAGIGKPQSKARRHWPGPGRDEHAANRSAEPTSEIQSLMRTSYAVFCLQKTKTDNTSTYDSATQQS